MKSKSINGIQLKEYGKGSRAVILIHGGPGLAGYMSSLGALISNDFFIVEYFQRDTAFSKPLGERVSFDQQLIDLKSIVDKYLHLDPIVVGHSYGGCLSLAFAGENPGLVNRYIILSCGPLNEGTRTEFEKELVARRDDEMNKNLEEAYKLIDTASTDEEKSLRYLDMLGIILPIYYKDPKTAEPLNIPSHDYKASMYSFDELNHREDTGYFEEIMRKIKDQVYAFHGDSDPIPCRQITQIIDQLVPHSKVKVIENCGHFPWSEAVCKQQFIKDLLGAMS